MNVDSILNLIQKGKSLGYSLRVKDGEKTMVFEYAIKKKGKKYITYFFKVDEDKMDVFEDYAEEELIQFDKIEEAINFIIDKGGSIDKFDLFRGASLL